LEEVGRSLALAEIEEDMGESCSMNYVPSLLPRQSHIEVVSNLIFARKR